MGTIKVSVVVPVYNREKLIRRCIDSIVNQTMPHENYEIIVVDDCSTDTTLAVLNEYHTAYPNLFRIFRNRLFMLSREISHCCKLFFKLLISHC